MFFAIVRIRMLDMRFDALHELLSRVDYLLVPRFREPGWRPCAPTAARRRVPHARHRPRPQAHSPPNQTLRSPFRRALFFCLNDRFRLFYICIYKGT